MMREKELIMNIHVIGHDKTGRKSIIESFQFNKLFDRYSISNNCPICCYCHNLNIGEISLKLRIWLPIPRHPVDRRSIRGSSGIMLVFDITKRETFDDLDHFLKLVSDVCGKNVGILLVGNIKDKEEDRQVSYEEAEAYGKQNSLKYIEVSSLKNTNINEAFELLANEIIERKKESFSIEDKQEPKNHKLSDICNKSERSYCC